jgi:hypothetical protein
MVERPMSTAQDTARIEMIERVKEVLGLAHTSDPEAEQAIGYDVDAALRWLNQQTNLDYSAVANGTPTARTWDAPPSSLLNIPALQLTPTPTVTLKSSLLTEGSGYRFIKNSAGTAYTQLERRVGGVVTLWNEGVTDVAAAISITGDWGLADDLADVWLAKAVRNFKRGQFHYGQAGNPDFGTPPLENDEDLEADLLPYWRAPVRQVFNLGTA